tara:strand:+ start:311 stop:976 length:666 start_codon:yes stop_codon:yes gene_type:complete
MSKNVFFDGGANKGQSLQAFMKNWPNSKNFEIHCYEPDRLALDVTKKLVQSEFREFKNNIHTFRKAVWIKDGEIDFFTKAPASEGNTILYEKVKKENRSFIKKRVECMDLSKWIEKNIKPEDFFILKLDIEGAEYKVVEHLDQSGVLPLIDVFFLEIHGLKCNKSFDESMKIVETLNNHNLVPYSWGAETFDYSNYKSKIYDKKKLTNFYEKWRKRGLSLI